MGKHLAFHCGTAFRLHPQGQTRQLHRYFDGVEHAIGRPYYYSVGNLGRLVNVLSWLEQATSDFSRKLAALRAVQEPMVECGRDLENGPDDNLAILHNGPVLDCSDHDD
jgi:hypothetical protein